MDHENPLRAGELTEREREVAGLIAAGLTNGQIAERLGIGFSTAKWHVSGVISKLGVDSREDVAARWKRDQSVRTRLGRLRASVLSGLSFKFTAVATGAAISVAGAFFAVAANGGGAGDEQLADATPEPATTAAEPTATLAGLSTLNGESIYIVQDGDSCPELPERLGVLGWYLIARDGIDSRCSNLETGRVIHLGTDTLVYADPAQAADVIRPLHSLTTPEQAPALADGVLTEDEYVAAVSASHACAVAAGVSMTAPVWHNGWFSSTFGPGMMESDRVRIQTIVQECNIKYFREIGFVWSYMRAEAYPPGRE